MHILAHAARRPASSVTALLSRSALPASRSALPACLSAARPLSLSAPLAMSDHDSDSSSPSARRIKVYTRTGDKGTSALFSGERRPKDDLIFEALGTTDELSSVLGLAREHCLESANGLVDNLAKIQCLLQDIGSNIATPRSSSSEARLARTEFDPTGALTTEVEAWIDALDNELPPLTKFILPSGGKAASTLHIARSICRRAERRVVPLVADGIADQSTARYLNRLSDYLFTAARYAAKVDRKEEVIYYKFTGETRAKVNE
ncbi:Adenosylcobalamin biosynthesis, ATP:cob(I)alamin adenosyltransferase-like protein [Entophlyctis helioformis]|nr:Adenosylcobalamin biosynthesis, ATP:cob(I)alamin adenosyltransferase-like protein [Entophlyctis helioformis]